MSTRSAARRFRLVNGGTYATGWANRFDGTNWGVAELIESDDGDASNPEIAMAADGSALAVWFQDDGTRANI